MRYVLGLADDHDDNVVVGLAHLPGYVQAPRSFLHSHTPFTLLDTAVPGSQTFSSLIFFLLCTLLGYLLSQVVEDHGSIHVSSHPPSILSILRRGTCWLVTSGCGVTGADS